MEVPRRILIVDDDRSITRTLSDYFELSGLEVVTVNDPRDAIESLRNEDIRVAILDIMMPEKSGLVLLQEIKSYDASVQIVMITGRETFSNLMTALHSGAEYIVLKPLVDLSELSQVVDRCFAKLDHWAEMIDLVRNKESSPA